MYGTSSFEFDRVGSLTTSIRRALRTLSSALSHAVDSKRRDATFSNTRNCVSAALLLILVLVLVIVVVFRMKIA